jgi:hypothetical protein
MERLQHLRMIIPIKGSPIRAGVGKAGWRDYCIVVAPEQSGLGACVVLLALVSRRAFVVAKRVGYREVGD